MGKRFTDTDKWKRPWFRRLSPEAKVLWFYILDQCDHAGIWVADFGLAEFQIGMPVNEALVLQLLGDKVRKIDTDKFYIPSFFDFQYANAAEGFKAKMSALKILSKLGVDESMIHDKDYGNSSEHFNNSSEQFDNSTDTVPVHLPKCTSKSKSILNNNNKEKKFDFETLYQKYPRKIGKSKGLDICRKQIKTLGEYEELSQAIDRYKSYIAEHGTDPKYIKYFSTFMNHWRDWIDFESLGEKKPDSSALRGVTF